MKLPDVLAAAMALSAEDRLKLVDAIAIIDDWHVEIVDKPKTMAEAIAEARPIATGIGPANKWKGFKHYKGESLEILRRAYSRYSNQLATGEERRRIVAETAEQLGRSYSGIYNKFLEMQNGQKK